MADNKKHSTSATASAPTDAEKIKTPRERMQTTGVNRVNAVLDCLRILGNVSDKATYDYSAEEWAKIKVAIDAKWAEVQKGFTDALAGKPKSVTKQGFGL